MFVVHMSHQTLLLSFSEGERQAIWMSKMMMFMSLTPLFVMVLREATCSCYMDIVYSQNSIQ